MFILRELRKQDIRVINNWRNSKELISFLGAPFRYINLEVDNIWYENYLNNRNSCVRCAIVEEDNPEQILGLVSLTSINSIYRSAEFHIMIGEADNRSRGLGKFATIEILKYAYNDLNLHRVELSVLKTNIRAIKLYEKIGFTSEGTKRQCIYKDGEFMDLMIMGLLKDEFIEKW